jgi:hypothetical protein
MTSEQSSTPFDPYHRWLGIPPEDQPPNHYRLLGLPMFEDDFEVVRDAAERQAAHVRRNLKGEHQSHAERLCQHIDHAKACLLQPAEKERYDDELREGEPLEVDL